MRGGATRLPVSPCKFHGPKPAIASRAFRNRAATSNASQQTSLREEPLENIFRQSVIEYAHFQFAAPSRDIGEIPHHAGAGTALAICMGENLNSLHLISLDAKIDVRHGDNTCCKLTCPSLVALAWNLLIQKLGCLIKCQLEGYAGNVDRAAVSNVRLLTPAALFVSVFGLAFEHVRLKIL
jgi:hypothetical protein